MAVVNSNKFLLKKSIDENNVPAFKFIVDSGVGKKENYWNMMEYCLSVEHYHLAAYLNKSGAHVDYGKFLLPLLKDEKYITIIVTMMSIAGCYPLPIHIQNFMIILIDKIKNKVIINAESYLTIILHSLSFYERRSYNHIENILNIYNICLSNYNVNIGACDHHFEFINNALIWLKNVLVGEKYDNNIEKYLNFFNIIHCKTRSNSNVHDANMKEYLYTIYNITKIEQLESLDEYILNRKKYFNDFMKNMVLFNKNIIDNGYFACVSHYKMKENKRESSDGPSKRVKYD